MYENSYIVGTVPSHWKAIANSVKKILSFIFLNKGVFCESKMMKIIFRKKLYFLLFLSILQIVIT